MTANKAKPLSNFGTTCPEVGRVWGATTTSIFMIFRKEKL